MPPPPPPPAEGAAPSEGAAAAEHAKVNSLLELEEQAQHKYDDETAKAGGIMAIIAAVPAPNLLLAEVTAKPVPTAIASAMAVAEEEGYVVRKMEESELVWLHYKKELKQAGFLGMLLMPFKFLSYGIYGPGGKERIVRAHGADTEEIKTLHNSAFRYDDRTVLVFRQLQMVTSLLASFAHGSNDVANAIGPLSSIIGVYWCNVVTVAGKPAGSKVGECYGDPLPNSSSLASVKNGWATPDWLLAVGGIMIGIGFWVYGFHLMRSLGNNLTYHSPSRGYCMEMGAAITVLFASRIGLPISTTQCITGATMAVGLLNGLRGVNWKRFSTIFLSWCITMPVSAAAPPERKGKRERGSAGSAPHRPLPVPAPPPHHQALPCPAPASPAHPTHNRLLASGRA